MSTKRRNDDPYVGSPHEYLPAVSESRGDADPPQRPIIGPARITLSMFRGGRYIER
jgi:hypothetical protein